MRSTKTLSISLPPSQYKDMAKLAKKESRTMSELIREALRRYQAERELEAVNGYGRAKAAQLGLTEADVIPLIHEFRHARRSKKTKPHGR